MIIESKNKEDIGNIGKVIVPKDVQKIIDYLHYKVGSTEWSGILFYKLIQGDINKLKDLVFKATFIYPMNIGSSAYTEFDYNGEVVNAYDIFEEGIGQSTGLVHSHHNMTAYFSGTDDSELMDNASNYNYYLSLVVNFAHDYAAKLAIPVKNKSIIQSYFKNTQGEIVSVSREKEEREIVTPVVTVTPEKFLICLLYCNSYATVDLKTAIKALNYKSEKALARYEESLDSNIEIIHENLYGNMDNFTKHCLDALNILHEATAGQETSEGFDIINQTLCSYVSL